MVYIPKKPPKRKLHFFYALDDNLVVRMIEGSYIELCYEPLRKYKFILHNHQLGKQDYWEIIEESTGCAIYKQAHRDHIEVNCIRRLRQMGMPQFDRLIESIKKEMKYKKIELSFRQVVDNSVVKIKRKNKEREDD